MVELVRQGPGKECRVGYRPRRNSSNRSRQHSDEKAKPKSVLLDQIHDREPPGFCARGVDGLNVSLINENFVPAMGTAVVDRLRSERSFRQVLRPILAEMMRAGYRRPCGLLLRVLPRM